MRIRILLCLCCLLLFACSQAEQRYLTSAITINDRLVSMVEGSIAVANHQAVDAMATEQPKPGEYDPKIALLKVDLDGLAKLRDQAKLLEPPEEFKSVNADLLSFIDDYEEIVKARLALATASGNEANLEQLRAKASDYESLSLKSGKIVKQLKDGVEKYHVRDPLKAPQAR